VGLVVIPGPLTSKRQSHDFSMWCSSGSNVTITALGSGVVDGAISFEASNLSNTTLFSAYEAYQINTVDIFYTPASLTGYLPAAATTSSVPYGYFGYDPDDNNTVTQPVIVGNATTVLRSLLEPWSMRISPRPSVTLFNNGVFSGYEIPKQPVLVDADNLSVPHFGLKYYLPQLTGASQACNGILAFKYNMTVYLTN